MSLLYLDHFGLKKPPFKITPDLDFFFAGGRRGDILTALLHVARHEEGIITVVAEVGSGKTLISRLMISQLGNDVCTVYLSNPCFSRDEILSAIARDLGLTDLPASTEARLSALHNELLRRHALGQRVLLVVDEAHAMPPESLEEVRLLSNLETGSHKLVNIMLFGQPELDTLLAERRLRQVRDRVIHRFELEFLPPTEASAYIDHRLRAAGWKGGVLFSAKAMALLVKESGGRARRINLLADKALLGAYAAGAQTVELTHVQAALQELHADAPLGVTGRDWRDRAKWALGAAMAGSVLTLFGVALVAGVPNRGKAAAAPIAAPTATPPVSASAAAAPVVPENRNSANTSREALAGLPLDEYLARTALHTSNPNLQGYTIQLAALPLDANVTKYLDRVGQLMASTMVFAQHSSYNRKKYIAVYYGEFNSSADASKAIARLPVALRTNKPIVRTWINIREN